MARALQAAGVEVGDGCRLLPNGIEFVRAFIAASRRRVAVPVNLPLSAPEVAHVLADCAPKAAFIASATQAVFARAAEGSAGIVRVAADADVWLTCASRPLRRRQQRALDIPFDADDCMWATPPHHAAPRRRADAVNTCSSMASQWLPLASVRGRPASCTTPCHRTGLARLMNMILHGSTLVVMPRFDAKMRATGARRAHHGLRHGATVAA